MIVQDFINEVSRRLRDVSKKQWDDDFLISATNAALGALTTTMPQAYSLNRDLTLVGGTEQEIDADLHKIVSILHNVSNVDGTPRRAVTKANMSVFDAAYPHWRQDPVRSYIRHYMLDEFNESKFYVWPPAVVGRGDEPVVPDEPVDPGALGDNGDIAVDGLVQSAITAPNRLTPEDNTLSVVVGLSSGQIYDIVLADPTGQTGTVSINEILYDNYTSGGSFDTLTDNEVALPWSDPRLIEGAILRVRFDGGPDLLGVDLYDPGTTQEDIDAYLAALAIYNAAVASHAAWAEAAISQIIRGVFTQTPYIDPTTAPVVPVEPVAPVDPGPLGTDGDLAPDGQYDVTSVLVTGNYNRLAILTPGEVKAFANEVIDLTFTNLNATRTGIVFIANTSMDPENPVVPSSYGGLKTDGTDGNSANIDWSDPRVAEGEVLRVTNATGSIGVLEVGPFEPGVTQAMIDAYLAALEQYNNDLTTYNMALANLAAYNADDSVTRIDDELPVKRAHIPALQEFAMYYAYSVDDDMTANSGRAQRHWLAFFQMLNKREDANLQIGVAAEITE